MRGLVRETVLTPAHLQEAFAVRPLVARDEAGGTHLVFT